MATQRYVAESLPGSSLLRTTFRFALNEPAQQWVPQKALLQFTINDGDILSKYTSYKINRVGIGIMPGSYVEWHVRTTDQGKQILINTRAELLRQNDTELFYNVFGGMKVYWYKPIEAIQKTWQDIEVGQACQSGLHLVYLGNNNLVTGTDGLLLFTIFDISLRGLIPNNIATTCSATFGQVEEGIFRLDNRLQTWAEQTEEWEELGIALGPSGSQPDGARSSNNSSRNMAGVRPLPFHLVNGLIPRPKSR